MTLFSPQALAIADGSVGLIELKSHVIGNVPKEPAKDAGGAAK
ncbi:hypothetical protein [Marinomonas spartinae]|nr:hypothetical protein [Marinomonas spartinae]